MAPGHLTAVSIARERALRRAEEKRERKNRTNLLEATWFRMHSKMRLTNGNTIFLRDSPLHAQLREAAAVRVVQLRKRNVSSANHVPHRCRRTARLNDGVESEAAAAAASTSGYKREALLGQRVISH